MKAVVDIGSNSVLLLVARREADGRLSIERDDAIITRLSRGVAASGVLAPEAIEATLVALKIHRAHVPEDCPVEAVATEALRRAGNAAAFLEPAAAVLGVPVRIISGDEEARLSYRSVALEVPPGTTLRVLDIGGGSTELVAGVGLEVSDARSHQVGAVRLTEALVTDDPPTAAQVEAVYRRARASLDIQPLAPLPELHGLAGTVTTAAALLLGLQRYDRDAVDGQRFDRAAVATLRDELARESTAERARRPTLDPGRADVVVAGLTILLAALDHCGASTLVVRDRGLRYALV